MAVAVRASAGAWTSPPAVCRARACHVGSRTSQPSRVHPASPSGMVQSRAVTSLMGTATGTPKGVTTGYSLACAKGLHTVQTLGGLPRLHVRGNACSAMAERP